MFTVILSKVYQTRENRGHLGMRSCGCMNRDHGLFAIKSEALQSDVAIYWPGMHNAVFLVGIVLTTLSVYKTRKAKLYL